MGLSFVFAAGAVLVVVAYASSYAAASLALRRWLPLGWLDARALLLLVAVVGAACAGAWIHELVTRGTG